MGEIKPLVQLGKVRGSIMHTGMRIAVKLLGDWTGRYHGDEVNQWWLLPMMVVWTSIAKDTMRAILRCVTPGLPGE